MDAAHITIDPEAGALAYELDFAHVFHTWSPQLDRVPLVVAGGSGSTLWDFDGNTYLDFTSQLAYTNVGHLHPAVIEAIADQARILPTVAPAAANLTRGLAARRISELAPEGMSKIFFTNGGADANENAIRMARVFTGRQKIISFYHSYHGGTGSAINATGDWRRQQNEYGIGHVRVFGPYLYRSLFASTTEEEESERALAYLESVIVQEGPSSIAGIIMETVVGSSGLLPPPPGYLAGVRALADRFGIVLIFDEVMSGFGRTGEWFAFENWGVVPDLITFAKGVNSGYVPTGGVIMSDEISAKWDHEAYPGGLTYSGHPLAMAAVIANLDAMRDEGMLANAKSVGTELLGPGLHRLAAEHPAHIAEARGLGLLWALEILAGEGKTAADAAKLGRITTEARNRGLLVLPAGNRIHLTPPLVITAEETAKALAILGEVFDSLD